VEGRVERHEYLAHEIEEQPTQKHCSNELHDAHWKLEATLTVRQFGPEFSHAIRAEHTVIVFGDTFATVKARASRTLCHGLTRQVVETALMT